MASSEKMGTRGAANLEKQKRKEKLLEALTKLGNRDTQRTASDELKAMIQELNVDGLVVLLSSICNSGKDLKPFAKKESMKLFGELSNEDCPVRGMVLTHPNVTKIVKFLRASLQDGDAGVRETAAELLGVLASHWSEHHKSNIPGEAANLFIKNIFDVLSEPKKEVQISAGTALAQISGLVAPVSRDVIKDILKLLKNANFRGGAQLLNGVCSSENGIPCGLVKGSPNAFKPFLSHFIGQIPSTTSGSGLVSFLSSKDWPLRKAAAEALKALAIIYGPELRDAKSSTASATALIDRSKQALQAVRFDKVKPVRDTILHALHTFNALEEFMQSTEVVDWGEFWEGQAKDSSPVLSSGKLACEEGQADEYWQNYLGKPPAGGLQPSESHLSETIVSPASRHETHKDPTQIEEKENLSQMKMEQVEDLDREPRSQGTLKSEEFVNETQDEIHDKNPHSVEKIEGHEILGQEAEHCVQGASTPPIDQSEQARCDEAEKLLHVERFQKAGVEEDVVAAPNVPQQGVESCEDDIEMEYLEQEPSSPGGVERDIEGRVVVPEEQWVLVMDRVEALERQQNRLFEMIEALGNRIDSGHLNAEGMISAMRMEMSAMQQNMGIDLAATMHKAMSAQGSRTGPNSPRGFMDIQSQRCPAGAMMGDAVQSTKSISPTPRDLDVAYSEALSIPNNELQLIRLIQKTGAVIPELSQATMNRLIVVFHQFLWEGRAVGRILPWFWQLVEPQHRHLADGVVQGMRIKIVGVLSDLKRDADDETAVQLQSLESSLRAVWGMLPDRTSSGKSRYNGGAGTMIMDSLENSMLDLVPSLVVNPKAIES